MCIRDSVVGEEEGRANVAFRRAVARTQAERIVKATEVGQRRQVLAQGLDLAFEDLALDVAGVIQAVIKICLLYTSRCV